MRIGHFVSFGIGGADRAAFNLLMGMKRLGLTPQVFFNDMSIPKRTADQDPNLPLLSIQDLFEESFDVKRIQDVQELSAFDLDILNTHRSGDDEWLLPGLADLDRKFKIVETNFHGLRKTPADLRVYPSHALMQSKNIAQDERNKMIFNPILPPLSAEDVRELYSIGTETVVLGRVGRSDKSIYSPKLLKTFARLEKSFDVHLLWIGASEKAKQDASKLRVKNVTWVEPTKSPYSISQYFNTFDIYCHANKLGETFGNTVAEAMFHRKPVASLRGKRTYPQAQFELLDDPGQSAGSLRTFHDLLEKFISNASLRRETGLRNVDRARENFEPKIVAAKYIDAYQGLLR